jgi:hypothetical protein
MNYMTDQTAKKTLFKYVKDQKTWFYWYHNPERINSLNKDKENWKEVPFLTVEKDGVIQKHLNDFFEATLDEVRLKKANAFSGYALWISGNHTLAYFREAASKREVAADIDYDMQRDHAVHTLYNYILGWYIFDNSEILREKFWNYLSGKFGYDLWTIKEKEKEKEFYKENTNFCRIEENNFIRSLNQDNKFNSINLANEFGDVWSITSLLHDVGYIFEGTISSASTEVENVRVSRGSKVVHDYFNHSFWEKFKVDFRAAQNIANFLDVSVPDFKNSQSLASLGDRLCDIGGCENIRKKLMELDEFKALNNEAIKNQYGLNREAFSIWNMYYATYDNPKMQTILEIVKNEYYDAMWKGSNQGFRNLNHGVCSGLIVLQALTFYHEFIWGFDLFNWRKFKDKQDKEKDHTNCISEQIYDETKDLFTTKNVPKEMSIRGRISPDFWFNKVLWATASIAIHDVIQEKYYEKICKKNGKTKCEKIKLDDDPLAFLGVLVDALQEWDRYTISGELAFSEKTELLQSTDVDIVDSKPDKISFYYPLKKGDDEKDFSKEIKESLSRCLTEWNNHIGIGVILLCPYCGAPFLHGRRHKLLETSVPYEGKAKCEYGIKIVDDKVRVTGNCNKMSTA